MRVTLPMMYNATTRDILRKQESVSRLSREISSGVRLHNPHDDPAAWGRSLDVQHMLQRMARYKDNLDFAANMLTLADSGLNHVHDLLVRAQEIAMAANTPNSSKEKTAYSEELDHLLDELALTVSQTFKGQSVFSGKPVWNETEEVWEWEPARAAEDPLQVVLGDGTDPMTVPCDLSGTIPDVMNAIERLKSFIEDEDSAGMTSVLQDLDAAMEQTRTLSAQVGVRWTGVQRRRDALDELTGHWQEQLSELRDTDIVQAITTLQTHQIALEAALKSSLVLKDLSLVHYL